MNQPSRIEFRIGPEQAGERLDRLLAGHAPEVSRARFQSLIAEGAVSVNGQVARRPGLRLKAGDEVRAEIPPPRPAEPRAQAMALAIVHEDDQLIVIDKPPGMVVHPAPGHEEGTLVNALLHHCAGSLSGIGGVARPGIVHRLDKDTSGLLVVAKTDAAHAALAEQFAAHGRDGRLERRYLALVWGAPPHVKGTVDEPLARSAANRKKIAVARDGHGREAITHYRVVERFADAAGRPLASLVECRLETGRTHQIRVHMAHIGAPVMGDATYASGFAASARRLSRGAREALAKMGRQALHAAELGFVHPATGERMRFCAPLPADMQALLAALRGEKGGKGRQ